MNGNGSSDLIELTIPAKREYIGIVRLMVSGIASRAGLAYDDIEDVKLAVSEACTNSVEHAYADREGTIQIQCNLFGDRLQIRVSDNGDNPEAGKAAIPSGPIDLSAGIENLMEGGLGLYLIHSLMDEVEVKQDQGIVVSMVKYLQRDGVAENVDTYTGSQI